MAVLDNNFEALITIGCDENGNGGTPLPDPATYEATTATLVNTGRNVAGKMIGSVIREDIAKVAATWKFLTTTQWATVCSLFNSANGGNFTNNVKFFNQGTGTWVVREMYVSDRTAGIYLRNTDGTIKGYTNPKLSLIEV